MGLRRSLVGVLLAVFLLLLAGTGIARAAPKLVIDRSHGQTADVSGLTNVLEQQGWVVSEPGQPFLTGDALNPGGALYDCSLLVVTQPSVELLVPEVDTIEAYVQGGGGLWVILDAYGPGPFDAVARRFGIGFNSDTVLWVNPDPNVVMDPAETFEVPIPPAVSSHPLFAGVTSFTYDGGASLNPDSSVGLVVNAPSFSWSDYYWGEAPILAAAQVGSGRVVCIGDLTPLEATVYPGLGDGNKRLLDNVVAWLKKPEPEPPAPPDPPAPDKVTISIRPWCKANKIDLNSKGFVRVAVLTTTSPAPAFDAKQIDPKSVLFTGAKPICWHLMNVDRDRDKDMLFLFHIPDLNLPEGSTTAVLTGKTKGDNGKPFEGSDSVQVIPKKKCKKPPQKGHDCGGKKGK